MLVQMELARIIISDVNDQQVVYLREIDGQRAFPILIGIFEAASINRHVKGEESQRPLTHDLLRNTIEQLGGELQDVVVPTETIIVEVGKKSRTFSDSLMTVLDQN